MNERSLLEAKVGDPMTVYRPSYRHGQGDVLSGTVTKVARKYLTITWSDGWNGSDEFERETGRQRVRANDNTSYAKQAYTPEGWLVKERREAVMERLQSMLRHPHNTLSKLSTEQLERIAAILEEQA